MSIQAILASTYYGEDGGSGPVADFTIEWWQKVENAPGQNSRPWSVGLYPTQILSLSYEGLSSDFFWTNNYAQMTTAQNHVGAGWRHMAYVRSSGVVRGYINGTQYTSNSNNSSLITDTNVPLYVGTGEISAGMFKGYITNLHIIKGVAKYTGNFTTPTVPVIATPNSVLLLSAQSGSDPFVDSTLRHGVSSGAGTTTWNSDTPFTAASPVTILGSNPWNEGALTLYIDRTVHPDIETVQAGWTFVSGNYTATVVSATNPDATYRNIVLSITSGVIDSSNGTFTQPALGGSLYFDGSSYLSYGASVDWAMDAY